MSNTKTPEIDITIKDERWMSAFPECPAVFETAVFNALEQVGFSEEYTELSLVLADNAFVQKLNKTWRAQDKPTNVLSFPQDEPGLLGDIILAYETVRDEAKSQSKAFADHAVHLVVHGLLHLLGHDHEDEREAQIMESLEIEILKTLDIKNPYETCNFMA